MVSPGPTKQISREQLVEVLGRLQAAGAWTPEQVAALLAEIDRSTAPPRPAPRGNRLAEAAAYAGAVLVGAAGVVLVGQHWEDLGRPGRVAILAGVTLVLAAVGTVAAALRPLGRQVFGDPRHAVRRRLASTALTLASVTAAGTVGVLATSHELLLAAVTAVAVMVVTQRVAPSAVSETVTLGAVSLLAGAVLDEAHAPFPAVVVVFSVLGGAWAALSRTTVLTVPVLALSLGLVETLYAAAAGAFSSEQPGTAIGIAILGLLAAGGLAGYVRTAAWPPAVVGVLALGILVLEVSSDTLGPVLAVFLTGLVLLAAGAFLLLRRSAGPN